MFRNLKIRTKILIAFAAIALIAVAVSAFIGLTIAASALEQESFNKLTAVREMKANQVEDYFQQISDQVASLSKDRMTIDAMKALNEGYRRIGNVQPVTVSTNAALQEYYADEFIQRLVPNLLREVTVSDYWPERMEARILQGLYITSNPNETGAKHLLDDAGDGSDYSQAHGFYHPIIRDYLERFGYYDIFLVAPDGDIVYSVFKEVDYGTSLEDGPYSDTNFARAFRAARDSGAADFVVLEDFEPYHPSYKAPAAFIASPIYDGEELLGVLVFQMPVDRINDIMTNKQEWSQVGLGESGETYLVGDDFLLRNQSRFLIEDSENYFRMIDEIGLPITTIGRIRSLDSTIGLQEVKTEGTEEALAGQTGTAIFPDYRGVPVLSAYKPLDIPDVNWAIISEIDEEEAFAASQTFARSLIIGSVALLAAIIIVAVLFSGSITRPLVALNESAGELASGHYDVAIQATGKDEIGQLALSFETMRQSIRSLIDGLEDANRSLENKVAARTEELEESRKEITDQLSFFQTIMEAMPIGIFAKDVENDYQFSIWNKQMELIFGVSSEEMLGKTDFDINLGEEAQAFRDTDIAVMDGHEVIDIPSEEILTQQGKRIAHTIKVPIYDNQGQPETLVGILEDITERAAAREALLASEAKHRTIF
ncbi:MAG: PAS domain-containing protein, partial [Chloroflexota bacterium]